MSNFYIQHPDEYERIVRLIKNGLTEGELARIINQTRAKNLVSAMGYETRFGSVYMLARLAVHLVETDKHNDLPATLPPPPDAEDTPTQDDPTAPECTPANCGGQSGEKGIPWKKALEGKPVSYSVDLTEIEKIQAQVPTFSIENIHSWFAGWAKLCGIRFEFVDFATQGKGDIHIQFRRIDGPGKTLGFALVPRAGATFMEQGGDPVGDITIDSDDRWRTEDELDMTGDHEVGHAIGFPHSKDPRDILFPRPTQLGRRTHGPGDRSIAINTYPLKAAA